MLLLSSWRPIPTWSNSFWLLFWQQRSIHIWPAAVIALLWRLTPSARVKDIAHASLVLFSIAALRQHWRLPIPFSRHSRMLDPITIFLPRRWEQNWNTRSLSPMSMPQIFTALTNRESLLMMVWELRLSMLVVFATWSHTLWFAILRWRFTTSSTLTCRKIW